LIATLLHAFIISERATPTRDSTTFNIAAAIHRSAINERVKTANAVFRISRNFPQEREITELFVHQTYDQTDPTMSDEESERI